MHRSLQDSPRDVRSSRCKRNDRRRQLKQKQRSDAAYITFPNIQIHPTARKHVNTAALPLSGQARAVPFSKASTKSLPIVTSLHRIDSIEYRTARPEREQHYSSTPPASIETEKNGGEQTVFLETTEQCVGRGAKC